MDELLRKLLSKEHLQDIPMVHIVRVATAMRVVEMEMKDESIGKSAW